MARLHLVKTSEGDYLLQGTGDASRNADFSLFDWDGEGGDPFSIASGQTWRIIPLPGIPDGVEYDADDSDSWWSAQAEIVSAAKKKRINVPDYATNY